MIKSLHIKISLILSMLIVISVLLPAREALCSLDGEADLRYVSLDKRDNNQQLSTRYLTQHYSVAYNKSDYLANGRLGKYNVSLGYDWLTFDTTIKSGSGQSENIKNSNGRITFNGEVLINPKEFPLRLKLYSRDLNRGSFSADSSAVSSVTAATPFLIPGGVITGLDKFQQIDSGATLVIGIKNGMTNGYNEILRHFPMLMLDYRDTISKDRSEGFPVDNRLTRLAFVSLNKKDNWFHYRYVTYNDYINSSNNFNEVQVQLGTVDHLLQRRWIDFSNWLKVSIDGQLTKRQQAVYNINSEEFTLNAYLTARRKSWDASTFTSFTRTHGNEGDDIVYRTSLPLYANGVLSSAVNWSAFTKYDDSHTDKGSYFKTALAGYSVNAFNRSPFTLSQGLSVEQSTASNSNQSLVIAGNISTVSTPLLSRNLFISAAYNIRSYRHDENNSVSNLVSQDFVGSLRYNATNNLSIKADQTSRLASGTYSRIESDIYGSTINTPQYTAPRDEIGNSSSSYQSITSVSVLWTPKPRLDVAFNVTEDIFVPDGRPRSTIETVGVNVGFTGKNIKLSSNSSYISGAAVGSDYSRQITSSNSASYILNRSIDMGATLSYTKLLGDRATDTIRAEQTINYNYYGGGGFSRKIFEINEMASVEDSLNNTAQAGGTGSRYRSYATLLGVKYYPTRQLMLTAGAKHSFENNVGIGYASYYGSLSLSFKLLSANLEYTYGTNKVLNQMEKRITANVRKKF